LSSSSDIFSKECHDLRKNVSETEISANLFDSSFKSLVLISFSFKDQKSAESVRRQLSDVKKKTDRVLQAVFRSWKISEDLKVAETN